MFLVTLAGFIVIISYLTFFSRFNNGLSKKQWLIIAGLGILAISYYYGTSYYAWHYGTLKHDCAIVTNNTYKERGRAQRNKPVLYVRNAKHEYRFVYYQDLYSNQFSFVGLKSNDKVCFDYVEVPPLAQGAPTLLKSLTLKSK